MATSRRIGTEAIQPNVDRYTNAAIAAENNAAANATYKDTRAIGRSAAGAISNRDANCT